MCFLRLQFVEKCLTHVCLSGILPLYTEGNGLCAICVVVIALHLMSVYVLEQHQL